ncbi:DNA-binding GntR family transcriptional regulator [Sphingobium sp. B2D3A]|uniref:GntR family transcriptional regulator n=1 Tax=unclassified Sphingobium TaxID=2611147 RepID=UPI0022240CDA|nr:MULTISPECIES: GntR family transcriptional regulator [unclassified Sphingobium]MCW2338186.1 DNA-binding GntR family transcriptional regulator [Sphingobium sp. B2D3A]MCW2384645.1 DNA-binding GntR family transcriptional regulator [Sphingobium sp. B2D3D]
MAPELFTQDRIYLAVKRDYLDGRFRASERIDIKAIADRHVSSPTPVREVLSRFVGEKLFEHRQEGGFRPIVHSGERLADMYAMHRDLIRVVLASADGQSLRHIMLAHRSRAHDQTPIAIAQFTASFFGGLADSAKNAELCDLIQALQERMLLVRIAEPVVLSGVATELRMLTRNGLVDIRSVIGKRIDRYHERRIGASREISMAMLN